MRRGGRTDSYDTNNPRPVGDGERMSNNWCELVVGEPPDLPPKPPPDPPEIPKRPLVDWRTKLVEFIVLSIIKPIFQPLIDAIKGLDDTGELEGWLNRVEKKAMDWFKAALWPIDVVVQAAVGLMEEISKAVQQQPDPLWNLGPLLLNFLTNLYTNTNLMQIFWNWCRYIIYSIFGETKELKTPLIGQVEDNWCWAASALMVGQTFVVSNKTVKNVVDAVKVGNVEPIGTSENILKAIAYASNYTIEYKQMDAPTITEEQIIASIRNGNPVYLSKKVTEKDGTQTAHDTVIYGFKITSKGECTFKECDPWPPSKGTRRDWTYSFSTTKNGVNTIIQAWYIKK